MDHIKEVLDFLEKRKGLISGLVISGGEPLMQKDIVDFASKVGVHPAIIAGMLQKETNLYSLYRKIVDKVNIRVEIFGDE